MPVLLEDRGDDVRRLSETVDLDRIAELLRPLASGTRLRLLRFLTTPHYLEEVASHLTLTRQAARKHLDQLVDIGVLERRPGRRDTGPVTEYVINPQALFLIQDEFEKLGSLHPTQEVDVMHRTMAGPGHRFVAEAREGPCLFVVRGLNVGHRHGLKPSPAKTWLVGRDHRCDVALTHDPYASNRHVEIRWEKGQCVAADLRSTNGTQYNWQVLPRGAEVVLHHGDLLGVGKTLLLFWDPSPTPR